MGEVTTATIATTPANTTPTTFRSISGFALPSLKLTPTSLLAWIVFTDGACEGPEGAKKGSVGGVLFSPHGSLLQFFGGEVPCDLMDQFLLRSKNPIYELEVMPVLLAALLWGNTCEYAQAYFDDYTIFSRDLLVSNTSKTVDNLFDLLGIEVAREGSKASGFSKQFKSLGVEIDLRDLCMGEARLGHTRERREEIGAVLDDILQSSSVTTKQAESLRGRLHWFESFAFGRMANGAVKTLGDLPLRRSKKVQLRDHEVRDLRFLRERVLQAPPATQSVSFGGNRKLQALRPLPPTHPVLTPGGTPCRLKSL